MVDTKTTALVELTSEDVNNDFIICVDVSDTTMNASGSTKKIRPINFIGSLTGWGAYQDTQYPSGSPFSVSALIDTKIPNNAGVRLEQELPKDVGVNGFYNSSTQKILCNKAGDGLSITYEFFVDRQSGSGSFTVTTWFEIGGSIPDLYKRTASHRGAGRQSLTATTMVYCLDTWLANGADFYINSDVDINIDSIRYIIHRTHAGRGSYS